MSNSADQAARELEAFNRFVLRSAMPIVFGSIEKRDPPHPDIYCLHREEGPLAFELIELSDEVLTKAVNGKRPPDVAFHWLPGPDLDKVRGKFAKPYMRDTPIELLCYTDGNLVAPDDVLLPTLIHEVDFNQQSLFRRVWFMGEQLTECLYSAA